MPFRFTGPMNNRVSSGGGGRNQISFFETLGLVILVAKSFKASQFFYVKESDSGVI
jgi:hypothetical protein